MVLECSKSLKYQKLSLTFWWMQPLQPLMMSPLKSTSMYSLFYLKMENKIKWGIGKDVTGLQDNLLLKFQLIWPCKIMSIRNIEFLRLILYITLCIFSICIPIGFKRTLKNENLFVKVMFLVRSGAGRETERGLIHECEH